MTNKQTRRLRVQESERAKIDRNVLIWLSSWPDLPADISKGVVVPESNLAADVPGMALSRITTAFINKFYILGGYQAEYQFSVIYRFKPVSMDSVLSADELLNNLGDWAAQNKPNLGDGIRVTEVTPTSQAELYSPYENGDEDHQIPIKIIYEVI